jgi:membrane associated rhomboid family serine protease
MFFPYSTDRDLERMPWATIILIAVNVLCVGFWVDPPLAKVLILNPHDFGVWQPATAMFMHAGLLHLVGNMVFLWVFGSHVEDTLGIPKYLALYFGCGLAASGLQAVADLVFLGHVQAALGASGAIMGIVALFCTRWRDVGVNFFYWYWLYWDTVTIRALWVGLGYVALNLLEGLFAAARGASGGVAFFAHLGGFGCGVLCSYALRLPQTATAEERDEKARALAASGAWGEAGKAVEASLRRDPSNAELHCRAALYQGHKDTTRLQGQAHLNRALVLWLRQGQVEEALHGWQQVHGLYQPVDVNASTMMALAKALEAGGWAAESVQIYDALVQGHPQDAQAPAAALRLADLSAEHGHADTARSWYEYICKHWPACYEALDAGRKLRG